MCVHGCLAPTATVTWGLKIYKYDVKMHVTFSSQASGIFNIMLELDQTVSKQ